MKAIISLFWQVLKFNRSPEDVPYSTGLLVLVLIANVAITAGGQFMGKPAHGTTMALALPLLSVGVELTVLATFLSFKRLGNRFVQTATTIFGCDTLLTLATIPLLILSIYLPKGSPALGVVGLLEVILLGWGLGLRAYIYHRALNIGLLLANMLAVTIFLLATLISVKVFPELLTQATAAAEAAKTKSP